MSSKREHGQTVFKNIQYISFQEKNTVEFYIYMHKMHPQLGGYHNNVHYNQCTTSFISPMSLSNESFREKSPERTSEVLFSSEVDVRTHKSHQVLDLLTLFICSSVWKGRSL